MEPTLLPQTYPVAIADGFIQNEPEQRTIYMRCPDALFKHVEVLDESGKILFTSEGHPHTSRTWRRTVRDAAGTTIFHLRTYILYWKVQGPGDDDICKVDHVARQSNPKALDLIVKNQADKGIDELVEVRPTDLAGVTVLVNIRNEPVASIQLIGANPTSPFRKKSDRSVWKAQIANGVDLALIVAIMLCRAELHLSIG
ncbi:hypothetical protein BGW36DRAFT_399413 [Talaromyces proteolyticus]|uniref:Uncharacterized protein n=1 Tax=Talaromyces proteolyticus TaxID=1131652 RepID=A0AAD4KMF6_9EURO|nr:uncharacterized protein BGW36DRAFT_399413 [Talaromyces proteolyticus]KAH8692575.1 hypothetical protein BGW36DRAFT_399413 [Talaromyces proteolyticus]